MRRNLRIVLVATAVAVLVYSIDFGGLMNFIFTVLIIWRAYVLLKRNKRPALPRMLPKVSVPTKAPEVTAQQIWIVALIFGVVLIFGAYPTVSAGAINFFTWGDHLLGGSAYPVLCWILGGLFFGLALGSLVIRRKYHIPLRWCLPAAAPFVLGLVLLQAFSDPMGSIVPRPLPPAPDTTAVKVADTTPVVHIRRKHQLTDTSCTGRLAELSINSRSDSVTLYYRTRRRSGGPWSAWKSKFIQQQGQFPLPGHANSLQYYYESKSGTGKSAEDPYTKTLCEGELVVEID
ncbi:hypothetical protein BEL04_08435 [Mucilaginibacter sp. PPCGB 2223]|uniref:hypothetical protein n=1 Tax=Mucilaginibacter sp. PPCGB 2223 TaxID=1886027 RepID=UPI0008263FEA|nr:hypothetical protein [Mucilaginibacter sp. PPCGB 2223]OCX54275.1 hypothetical protein BEL04_08435 [Mucilaginibacter sp. PPCGB 2223]